jgi:PhoH-like ATPase
MYVELKSLESNKHTALGKVDASGFYIKRVSDRKVSNISPRNREQVFAIDALMDNSIPIVVLTGTAGTGKSFLTLAAAMEMIEHKMFQKVILTRPMSEVGKYKLGALPGAAEEKFSPYLLNYMTNLEQFVQNKHFVTDLIDQHKFEIVPLQLFRGASFNDCLVICDEMQVCNFQEILTVGTRIGHNSKIVLMGDLNQRDEKIAKEKTGLHKLMIDKQIRESSLVATIQLLRCERSETAKLFASVFEE